MMSENLDALEHMNCKVQNRIDKIYHPFANTDRREERSRYLHTHTHGNRKSALDEDSLNKGRNLSSHQPKHKVHQMRRIRDGKREKKAFASRGGVENMGDFVLRQEKKEEEENLRNESQLHLIDLDRYLEDEYKDSDKDYDADYEEDQITEFDVPRMNDLDSKTRDIAQEQLEEMLRLEELELEMLTANLSLIDDFDLDDNEEVKEMEFHNIISPNKKNNKQKEEPREEDASIWLCSTP